MNVIQCPLANRAAQQLMRALGRAQHMLGDGGIPAEDAAVALPDQQRRGVASVSGRSSEACRLGALIWGGWGSRKAPLLSSQAWLLAGCGYRQSPAFYAGYATKNKRTERKPQARQADTDDEADEADLPEFSLELYQPLMDAAVEHLHKELAGVRTGRASPALLEPITVEVHGERLPLKAVGMVTARGPHLLVVSVFDSDTLRDVERAIRVSPMALNPSVEGGEVLVPVPKISKDTIAKMVKLVYSEAESAKVSVRHARQKGMEATKQAFTSKDERKRAERELQQLHDKFIQEIERLRGLKEAELKNL